MQLLILNEHSIVWGVGKSLNWKHMKKNALIFFLTLWREMALVGEKMHLQRGRLVKCAFYLAHPLIRKQST